MKTLKQMLVVSLGLALITITNAWAQSDEPQLVPVEIFLCKYNKGKGPRDLDRATAAWNEWMDEVGETGYTAWIMTPMFFNENIDFDVAWLGAWANGKVMGASNQRWVSEGGDLQAGFDRAVECHAHLSSASMNIKPPQQDNWPGETGVVTFADCTLGEGRTMQEALDMHNAWADHLAASGSSAGIWAWFTGLGAGQTEHDYKIVTGFADHNAAGAEWERFTNGGGWRKAAELNTGATSCDSARLYNSRTVRNGNVAPD